VAGRPKHDWPDTLCPNLARKKCPPTPCSKSYLFHLRSNKRRRPGPGWQDIRAPPPINAARSLTAAFPLRDEGNAGPVDALVLVRGRIPCRMPSPGPFRISHSASKRTILGRRLPSIAASSSFQWLNLGRLHPSTPGRIYFVSTFCWSNVHKASPKIPGPFALPRTPGDLPSICDLMGPSRADCRGQNWIAPRRLAMDREFFSNPPPPPRLAPVTERTESRAIFKSNNALRAISFPWFSFLPLYKRYTEGLPKPSIFFALGNTRRCGSRNSERESPSPVATDIFASPLAGGPENHRAAICSIHRH